MIETFNLYGNHPRLHLIEETLLAADPEYQRLFKAWAGERNPERQRACRDAVAAYRDSRWLAYKQKNPVLYEQIRAEREAAARTERATA